MVDKDIEHCLAVLKDCINERQSAFDYKLISTLEKCKGLEAENKALKAYANNVIKCLNDYEDSQTSEEYKQTLDDFHHGVFLLSEGIAKL